MSSKQLNTINDTQVCPCGSQQEYKNCCQPIISKTVIAETAEQLMRSRFSAYCIKDAHYILSTYAVEKQIDNAFDEIKEWAEQTQWLALNIITSSTEKLGSTEQYDFVEFAAEYRLGDEVWRMHERSRFIQESGEWRYLDGEIISHDCLKKVTRNSPCPCGSTRKYKRCCMTT